MIGERIGNYVITEKLGEGGMGEVYLAEHPQIGKKVALKVLHAELAANEEITTRFFHEAKAVNDISHPNIVDIIDFGSLDTEKGQVVYLVMELLAGTTLTKLVADGPMDPLRAVRIVRQVADALVSSHENGIVHRDLKPDNIMLVSRGREQDFVKLLDFGIAKVQGSGSMRKTRTGMVIGTPIYMSPEQCEGRGDIDHRTDVYALGTVLYELLTGAPPFTGEGYAEVLVKQLTEIPEPVSARRPGLSRYLESIVMRSLAKRREDRFQTMREMLEALSNPQEFVEARGGVAAFGGPQRSNPPTGPQLPTPLHGQPYAMPTPMHGGHAMPTPMHGGHAMPTPMYGAHGMPTPMHGLQTQVAGGAGMPTPMHGVAQPGYPTPFHGTGPQTGAAPYQTTLSGGVGEVGRAGRGTEPPPVTLVTGGSSKKLLLAGLAAVVVAAAVIGIVVVGGGKSESKASEQAAAAQPDETSAPAASTQPEQPTTPSAPSSPPAAGTTETTAAATTTPATTAPQQPSADVKISIATSPAGASVFVAGERKARCETPCAVELPRGDAETKLAIKLDGFVDEKRSVTTKTDLALDIELSRKAVAARPPSGGTSRPGAGSAAPKKPKGPVGDNTLNPFDN